LDASLIATIVATITTVLAWAGIGYYVVALWGARTFVHDLGRKRPGSTPPVSILKPLRGLDHEMYSAFASHCRQEYAGEYEILFGVSSLSDPAVAAVQQLQDEFPNHNIRIIECPETLGANGKVSNLVQMLRHARHPYIVINDSDIVVSPHYLTNILSGFAGSPAHARPVGMVTAPYRGRAHGHPGKDPTAGSRMEALGISTDFFPGVLTARLIEGGIRFGLGSTLAVSREALDRSGGSRRWLTIWPTITSSARGSLRPDSMWSFLGRWLRPGCRRTDCPASSRTSSAGRGLPATRAVGDTRVFSSAMDWRGRF